MFPIMIVVHFLDRENTERMINVNNITFMAQHVAHIMRDGENVPTTTTDICFTDGTSMRNVKETPEEIYQMIRRAVQDTTLVVGNQLIAMGFLR